MESKELISLFDKRDKLLMEYTENIFNAIPHVLAGCVEFISKQQQPNNPIVEWDNIILLKEEQLILLIGSITYDNEDIFTLQSGETIELTENFSQYFRAMLKMGIPVEVVESGSVADVVDFLIESTNQQELTENIENFVDFSDSKAESPHFDLNELTEEQRKSMELFLASQGLKEDNS